VYPDAGKAAANSSPSFPMATEEFSASISTAPVEEPEASWRLDPVNGADVRFLGVVRETEHGRRIQGIDYSCYARMAEKELLAICADLLHKHPDHKVLVHHRTGFVPAGVASLIIRIRTPHSAEAFDLVREYLKRIKATVPVWKTVRYESE
jgi:molybdopterin synthase catalytic subunit